MAATGVYTSWSGYLQWNHVTDLNVRDSWGPIQPRTMSGRLVFSIFFLICLIKIKLLLALVYWYVTQHINKQEQVSGGLILIRLFFYFIDHWPVLLRKVKGVLIYIYYIHNMVFFIEMRITTLFCSVHTFRNWKSYIISTADNSLYPPPFPQTKLGDWFHPVRLSRLWTWFFSTHDLKDAYGCMDFSEKLSDHYSPSEDVHLEFSY